MKLEEKFKTKNSYQQKQLKKLDQADYKVVYETPKVKHTQGQESHGWGHRSTICYKTKFGSQNFGYQIWSIFCNTQNVFKNMFNMSLMVMWWNIMVQWFPHDWDAGFEKFEGLLW